MARIFTLEEIEQLKEGMEVSSAHLKFRLSKEDGGWTVKRLHSDMNKWVIERVVPPSLDENAPRGYVIFSSQDGQEQILKYFIRRDDVMTVPPEWRLRSPDFNGLGIMRFRGLDVKR